MKYFIIFFLAFLSVHAEDVEADIANTDELFNNVRGYQYQLSDLQDEIDRSIEASQNAVSDVLKTYTNEALRQYQTNIQEIEVEYAPHYETFNQLDSGSCKDNAYAILNSIITFTGFEGSNCAKYYDNAVRTILAGQQNALDGFDEVFSQLQSIAVKAFVGKNAFVSPGEIEDSIAEIFNLVKARWEAAKPQFEGVRISLLQSIGMQLSQLRDCHNSIVQEAQEQFAFFNRMAEICMEFVPQSFKGRSLNEEEPWVKLTEEFFEQFSKLKSYEWK